MAKTISLDNNKVALRVDGTTFDTEIKTRTNEAVGFIIDAGIDESKFTFTTDVYMIVSTGYDSVDVKIIGLIQSFLKVMFGYDEEDGERSIPKSWFIRLNQTVLAFKGREDLA